MQQQIETLEKNLEAKSRSLDDCNSAKDKLLQQTPKLPVGEGLSVESLKKGNQILQGRLQDQEMLTKQADERNVQLKKDNDRLVAEKSVVEALNSKLQ